MHTVSLLHAPRESGKLPLAMNETASVSVRVIRAVVVTFAVVSLFAGGCGGNLPPDVAEARRAFERGDYPAAAAAAERARATYPDHPERWRVHIEAVHRQGDASRATELYREWYQRRQVHDHKVLARLALTTLWQGLRVPSAQVRVATILAVERQEVEKLADEVDALMTSDSDIVAAAAATALLRGRPGAPRIATQVLVSEDPAARAIAVAGIGRKIGKRARVDLTFSLRDGDPRVRIAGIGALAPMGDPADTDRLLALATRDGDGPVRARALASLQTGKRAGARDAGLRGLTDADLAVRLAAVALLRALGERDTLATFASAHTDAAAIHAHAALVRGPTAESAQAMAQALADAAVKEQWAQRVALIERMTEVVPGDQAKARLRALASDPDGRVRVAAAAGLLDLKVAEGTPLLSTACADEASETRAAAIAAHIERKLLTPGLIDALADDSALIRIQAAEAVWRATR